MRSRKGWALALVLLLTALCLAGCKPMTLEEQLQKAQENMAQIKNVEATTTITMGVSLMSQEIAAKSVVRATLFSDPLKMKADIAAEVGGEKVGTMTYLEQQGDMLKMYLYDGSTWTSEEVPANTDEYRQAIQQYDIKEGMATYLKGLSNIQVTGQETLNGKECIKVEGVLTGEAMQEAIQSSGMLDTVDPSLGSDEKELQELLSGLADMPISLWIQKDNLYPVQYAMDMTGLLSGLMEKAMSQLGAATEDVPMAFTNCLVQVTLSNFNQATEFEIPADALAS